jgi:LysM repeat protein
MIKQTGIFITLFFIIIFNLQIKPAESSALPKPFQPDQVDFQKFLLAVQGAGPPQTIRVRITGQAVCDVNAPYTVVTMDFNTYVKNVLPNEWPHWWHGESLKAGAVAVKMYAWYWVARGGKWSDADVIDSTCDQRYRQGSSHPSTDRAVDDTWGFALTREGSLFETQHRNSQACQPPTCMRQSVTSELAREGYSWKEILAHFYTGSNTGSSVGAYGIIVPVEVATPDHFGKVIHVVEPGQSLWAIAEAYGTTISELEMWNNVSSETKLKVGEYLFIPGESTEGHATPTPLGMIAISTPDVDGIVMHHVQPAQTLSTIAQAYDVTINRLLILNNLKRDWPLSNGQKLIIDPGHITPSPTARPLTPVEKLTPASDGKYYHIVESGQNLSWIAELYNISLFELLEWNELDMGANLQPEQKLLLRVTPPATDTPTPSPPSDAGTPATGTLAALSENPAPTQTNTRTILTASDQNELDAASSISTSGITAVEGRIEVGSGVYIGLFAGTIFLIAWIIVKRNRNQK